MTAEELKKQCFGDFLEHLKEKNIGDHFSMDIWMTKVWELLYGQFIEARKRHLQKDAVLQSMSEEDIKKAMDFKKELKDLQKKKIISPDGK